MYTPIVQQISNHPNISYDRMVETEIFFKKDRILLFCRVYYANNGVQIESIPEKLFIFSTVGLMVNPLTGHTVQKNLITGEFPEGSMVYTDYLALIPTELPNSTTTYGNIQVFTMMKVATNDADGDFNK